MKKVLFAALLFFAASNAFAEYAKVLEAKADVAIEEFDKKIKGGKAFLDRVEGYLVFPDVYKGGFFVGAEYGEGVLRVKGKTVGYYSMTSASIGLQFGAQKLTYIFAFADKFALEQFMKSDGWEVGVDGSVALIKWGQGVDLSTISFEKPIYAFVFNNKGLMANISLEGTKFTRIIPQQ